MIRINKQNSKRKYTTAEKNIHRKVLPVSAVLNTAHTVCIDWSHSYLRKRTFLVLVKQTMSSWLLFNEWWSLDKGSHSGVHFVWFPGSFQSGEDALLAVVLKNWCCVFMVRFQSLFESVLIVVFSLNQRFSSNLCTIRNELIINLHHPCQKL